MHQKRPDKASTTCLLFARKQRAEMKKIECAPAHHAVLHFQRNAAPLFYSRTPSREKGDCAAEMEGIRKEGKYTIPSTTKQSRAHCTLCVAVAAYFNFSNEFLSFH
jgi:hypothetical protein